MVTGSRAYRHSVSLITAVISEPVLSQPEQIDKTRKWPLFKRGEHPDRLAYPLLGNPCWSNVTGFDSLFSFHLAIAWKSHSSPFFFWHGLKVYVTLTPKREGTRWPAQWIAQLGHAPSIRDVGTPCSCNNCGNRILNWLRNRFESFDRKPFLSSVSWSFRVCTN